MTVDQLINLVVALPQAKAIGDKAYWALVVPDLVQHVVDEMAMSFDFDFTLNEYSTTTDGTATMTLTGENMDLRDIATIRYNSTDVLQRMRPADAFDLIDSSGTLGGVYVWYQSGVDSSGFPKVTFLDTPPSGKTLNVSYRRKNIPLSAIPNDFGWVLGFGALSWVNPEYRVQFERSLKKMMRRYQFGGKDTNIAMMDPHASMDNRTITNLSGAG